MAEEKKKKKFSFKILQDLCMDCATCWHECQYEGGSGAIGVVYNGVSSFEIDDGTCIACGRCFRACPVDAIERTKNA